MHDPTVAVYQRSAAAYGDRRRAYQPDRAGSFAAALAPGGVRLDLGCGPGHYVPLLGTPVVAVDAAPAMVAETRRRHPGVPAVAADLELLPLRPGSVQGVWASKSLQHVERVRLPMALAGLHRALAVGGTLDLTVFRGDGERTTGPDDDFPGRRFVWWQPGALADVLVGAGFTVEEITPGATLGDRGGTDHGDNAPDGNDDGRHGDRGGADHGDNAPDGKDDGRHGPLTVRATRARTLPDTVGAGMRLLVCGLNPSLYAADAGVGFARPGNRFWPAALASGLVTTDRSPDRALLDHSVGMTDIVKRATVAAAELSPAEYRAGLARIERLVSWLRPRAVCFVGLAGWRAAVDRRARAGRQPAGLAGVPVYVMPSTSGLNARTPLAELADHLRAAARLADGDRRRRA